MFLRLAIALTLALFSPLLAQTVKVQGQDVEYKLLNGRQMVPRKPLAKIFPGFPQEGSETVDLAVLLDDPNARVMRRNGLIVSVRYYSSNMARMYSLAGEKAQPRGDAPNSTTPVSSGGYRVIMDEIVRLSNLEREAHGVPPLTADPLLEKAATGHSEEMAALGYFSHTSPTAGRETPSDRIRLAGVDFRASGENIASFTGHAESTLAEKAVRGWMNSPPHRKNLLSPMFTHVGIGVGRNGEKYTLTQNFASY